MAELATPRPRVAVAGFGMAGAEFHAPLVCAAGLELVAIATADPARVERAGRRFPGVRVVPGLADLLELDLDLIVLATPTAHHEHQALQCCAAGVATVVDKPLATSAAGARRVVEAFAAARVPLSVFQNRRYDAEHTTMLQVLAADTLGQVVRFEKRWERWRPQAKQRWRETATWRDGGGLLLDLHAHLIDNAVHAFGPITSVYAETAAFTTVAEDVAFVACAHAGGVRSHLGATSLAAAPGPRVRLLGTRGAYLVTTFGAEPTAFGGWEDAAGFAGWIVDGEERHPVAAAHADPADYYRAVAVALAGGAPMPVDPRDAVHVLAVVDAARRSAEAGQVMSV